VPVVPIVIRNAGELMWKQSTLIRSGTVDVVVHPPIDVGDWAPEALVPRIEEVEQLYRDTLSHWPRGEA
ncbi:MAG: HAD-IB family hydrolase, partial [Tomitella sp.]|nr:HAD-IB family hydrolase [Tomitella sp.]